MKQKKLLALFAASLGFAAMGMLSACFGSGDDDDDNDTVDGTQGLYYWESDDGLSYTVAIPNGTEDDWDNMDIVIPATYHGKPVSALATGAFDDTGIKSITLPDSITKIADQAFEDCTNLKAFDFTNITEIGDFAFEGAGLETVNLPASVTKIGVQAFQENENLKTVTVNGNAVIGDLAFDDCPALTTAEFLGEESLTLGVQTFSDCSALKSVTISAANATLDDRTFMDCKPTTYAATLETIYKSEFNGSIRSEFPKELIFLRTEVMPQNTVSSVSRVTSITLPATLKHCEQGAFLHYNLSTVTFEGTVADWCAIKFDSLDSNPLKSGKTELVIGGNTVAGKLTIPAGVTKIGDHAFYNYKLLNEVELPAGVTEIGKYAFCNNYFLYSVNLPEGLTTIGNNAFCNCSLIEATLPQSLTALGTNAFQASRKLARIVNKSALTETAIQDNCRYVSKYFEIVTEADGSAVEKVGDFVFWKDENGSYSLMLYVGSEKEITLPATVKGSEYSIHPYAFESTSLDKITFADTANWHTRYRDIDEWKKIDVTDPVANAEKLQRNYNYYEWCQIDE